MTTTIVYGDVADGRLTSSDASYATARNGPASAVNNGTSSFYGQNNNVGVYTHFQTFLRFAYPAVTGTEVVTAASVQTFQISQLSVGVLRDMELRGAPWGTSLELADWRTPAQLTSSGLFGLARDVQGSQNKWVAASSESLRSGVGASAFQEFVLVSSRQRLGNVPTTDEVATIATADQTGTTQDPRLVFTTTTRTRLMPIQGMAAQLSDGSWIAGVRALGSAVIDIVRTVPAGGPLVTVATIPLGTTSTTWADVPALQGMTLTVDAQDNLYVVGRAGDAPNSLRVQANLKAPSSWTWSGGTVRTVAAPAHDAPINNLAAAWHSTAGGTLAVFAGHGAGDGVNGGDPNDLTYLLLSSQYLLDGTGAPVRASGSAQSAGLVPSSLTSGDFSGWANETGTGLDVVADVGQPDWGYVTSFKRAQRLGDNQALSVGRYILTGTGTGFLHASYQDAASFGTKDAGGRLRVLSVSSGQVALVTADKDTGYGLSVEVFQASGTTPGLVRLGYVRLAGETIAGMPDGPAIASSPAWDAVYSASENLVWVYYVDTTTPTQLRRTSVSLDTYQATRVAVAVGAAASAPIRAVRAARNARVVQTGHVTYDTTAGYTVLVDAFNLPPLAPTLTAKTNYDATAAGVFAWSFQDPNAGDTQSAYQLQVVRVSDGATVLDTGKVLSAAASRTVAGGTLANGVDYRWRVMTWDALGVAGPWSPYGTFSTSASGTVTITDPATDNLPGVIADDYAVRWTVAGTVQAKFRAWVTRNDTGATVYDSGWLTSSATSATVAGMVSDVEHTIRVQAENASAVRSGIGARLITPSYGSPEAPLVTLTPDPEGGYVLVAVDNPAPQGDRPEVARNRILRRPLGSTGAWEVLGECEPDGTFRDYTASGRVPLEYMVRGESA